MGEPRLPFWSVASSIWYRPQLLICDVLYYISEYGSGRLGDEDYRTDDPKIFACGDMRRGASLVVWAIREGRECARVVDKALEGYTNL